MKNRFPSAYTHSIESLVKSANAQTASTTVRRIIDLRHSRHRRPCIWAIAHIEYVLTLKMETTQITLHNRVLSEQVNKRQTATRNKKSCFICLRMRASTHYYYICFCGAFRFFYKHFFSLSSRARAHSQICSELEVPFSTCLICSVSFFDVRFKCPTYSLSLA